MGLTSLSDKRLSRSLKTAMSTSAKKESAFTLKIEVIPEDQVWEESASSYETKK